MAARSLLLLTLLPFAAISACGGHGGFVGEVLHPAELPVRAFAPIVVAHANDADSIAVATGVVEALVRGGTEARTIGALETVPPGGRLRIEVAARFRHRSEIRWSTRPENVCGPYGCYVRQVSYPYDVSVLVGEAVLRIFDVTSGSLLAERTALRELAGGDGEYRRAGLRGELIALISSWIDPRIERVRVDFRRVRIDGVSRAREHARASRWDEAATELEAVVASDSFTARTPSVRADVLHDLALAIRFGSRARTEPVSALTRALSHAEEAVRLDSLAAHVALRDALRAQREEARVLERQAVGTVETGSGTIPVPAGYGP